MSARFASRPRTTASSSTSDGRGGRRPPASRLTARPAGNAGRAARPVRPVVAGRAARERGPIRRRAGSRCPRDPPARLGSRRAVARGLVRFLPAAGAARPRLGTSRRRGRGREKPRPIRPVALAPAAPGRARRSRPAGEPGGHRAQPALSGGGRLLRARASPGGLPGLAERTAAWVASVPDGDRLLGRALAAAPSVIGLAGLDGPAAVAPRGNFTPVVVRGEVPSGQIRRYRTVLPQRARRGRAARRDTRS